MATNLMPAISADLAINAHVKGDENEAIDELRGYLLCTLTEVFELNRLHR